MSVLIIILVSVAIPFLLVTTLVSLGNQADGPLSGVVRFAGSLLPALAVAALSVAGLGSIVLGVSGSRSLTMTAAGVICLSYAALYWISLRSIHHRETSEHATIRRLLVCLAVANAAMAVFYFAYAIQKSFWQALVALIPAWFAFIFARFAIRPQEFIGEP